MSELKIKKINQYYFIFKPFTEKTAKYTKLLYSLNSKIH